MALYCLLVSALYALLWTLDADIADALVAAVVLLILVPAVFIERSWVRRR